MNKLVRTRFGMSVVLALLVACMAMGSANAGLFSIFKGKSKRTASIEQVHSLVVFPFDVSSDINVPEAIGGDFASELRVAFASTRRYNALVFSDKLAAIQRARFVDTKLQEVDYAPPFTEDNKKPQTLAQLLAVDYYVVGSIESCTYDESAKYAEISVSAIVIDTVSGKTITSVMEAGHTPKDASATSKEDAISLAAGDALAKLQAKLISEPTAAVVPKKDAVAAKKTTPAKATSPLAPAAK